MMPSKRSNVKLKNISGRKYIVVPLGDDKIKGGIIAMKVRRNSYAVIVKKDSKPEPVMSREQYDAIRTRIKKYRREK